MRSNKINNVDLFTSAANDNFNKHIKTQSKQALEIITKTKQNNSLAGRRTFDLLVIVKWFLSTDKNDLPEEILKNGTSTFRSITVDGKELQFSEGFTDLHNRVYEEILNGNGFGIEDARSSITLVQKLRSMTAVERIDNIHPFALKYK